MELHNSAKSIINCLTSRHIYSGFTKLITIDRKTFACHNTMTLSKQNPANLILPPLLLKESQQIHCNTMHHPARFLEDERPDLPS